jgi:Flp pilus assembly pilin Flp
MDAADRTPTIPDTDAQVRRTDRERGQSMVEYAFILMLVAIVLILSVQIIGHQTTTMYSNVSNGFNVH